MSVPTTTMRIDEEVKLEAKPILEKLGLNISSATNIFLKAVVRYKGLPFDLRIIDVAPIAPEIDFTAEYLAPIMSKRNEITRIKYNPKDFREKLARRNAVINRERRTVL